MLHEQRERRGFGRLRQLPSKRWQAAYTGPDTALHSPRSTFMTKDDAVAWLAAERKPIDLDSWTPPSERRAVRKAAWQTVREFADQWLASRKTATGEPLKARTVADYRRYLDQHILPTLGSMPLRQLTPARVQAWYDDLEADTPTQRAHVGQLLRAIATTATDKKLIPANPCKIRSRTPGLAVAPAGSMNPASGTNRWKVAFAWLRSNACTAKTG